MPAQWARVQPSMLQGLQAMPGGTMLLATAAKKHVTFFVRSRRAPGAGSPEVKSAFAKAANKTLGIESRADRNAIISSAVSGKGTGIYRRKSRASPRSPLFGKVYEVRTR